MVRKTEDIAVVGLIVLRGTEILAFRRAKDRSMSGRWEFPGGKVDGLETDEAALVREIKEELNINLNKFEFFDRTTTDFQGLRIKLTTFTSTQDISDSIKSTDHDLIQWVSLENAQLLAWSPADIPALNKLIWKFRDT